jgi:peptide/nickel transport system substrate-binding protein
VLLAGLLAAQGCAPEPGCPGCDTLVIAAVGEPGSLLPPLVFGTVGRDISDRIFQRLADLPADASPVDPDAYRPALAESWQRLDDRRWRFALRRDATWHDGAPFTAADVRFSFEVFSDPAIDALALASVQDLEVTVVDDFTVDIAFPRAGPEQLYDATYHVRILPRHLWGEVGRDVWAADTASRRIVGTGPYRLVSWDRPATLRLAASGINGHDPAIPNLVWTFQHDPDAAANLLLSHDADVMEAMPPARVAEADADHDLVVLRYPSAVYGFLAFNLAVANGASRLRDREIRRALAMAIDRKAMAQVAAGPGTAVPRGPMSGLLWINDEAIRQLPFDTVAARAGLAAGDPVAFDILVPSTSRGRQRLAEALQEAWRRQGVAVSVTAVDFPVFIERIRRGNFDSYIGAMLDEPSARGLADQWTRAGWVGANAGRYHNPVFDSLVTEAMADGDAERAKALWVEAVLAAMVGCPERRRDETDRTVAA